MTSILKMEAIYSSETLMTIYKTTRHRSPKDHNPPVFLRKPQISNITVIFGRDKTVWLQVLHLKIITVTLWDNYNVL
jgi:hypothetical protein